MSTHASPPRKKAKLGEAASSSSGAMRAKNEAEPAESKQQQRRAPLVIQPEFKVEAGDEELHGRLVGVLKQHPQGMASDLMMKAFQAPEAPKVVELLNLMLRKKRVEMLHKEVIGPKGPVKSLYYRLIAEDEAKALEEKFQGMENNDLSVYAIIEQSGNQGLWVAHIRRRSGLHSAKLQKILKKLTQKKLIKCEKSIASKNRKVYMLYNMEPALQVKGRVWYTHGTYDKATRDTLAKICLKLIQQKKQATAIFLAEDIKRRGIFKDKDISEDDVVALLQCMCYDGTLEPCATPGDDERESVLGKREERDVADVEQSYRERRDNISNILFTEIPCAVCPVAFRCRPGAPVNPQECRYFQSWLDL